MAALDDGTELAYDLFLGVPKHRAPDVVLESGMAEDGYVPVTRERSRRGIPDVYAVGDVATVGVPKAGVFAEGAARVVAAALLAQLRGGERPEGVRRTRLLLHRVRSRAASAGSTSTSSPARNRPARSRSRPARSSRRSSTSARAAAPAGSAAEPRVDRRARSVEQRVRRQAAEVPAEELRGGRRRHQTVIRECLDVPVEALDRHVRLDGAGPAG